jgi:hypothetical protein
LREFHQNNHGVSFGETKIRQMKIVKKGEVDLPLRAGRGLRPQEKKVSRYSIYTPRRQLAKNISPNGSRAKQHNNPIPKKLGEHRPALWT